MAYNPLKQKIHPSTRTIQFRPQPDIQLSTVILLVRNKKTHGHENRGRFGIQKNAHPCDPTVQSEFNSRQIRIFEPATATSS